MKHLCDCGEIAEVEGIIATCNKCGSYYIYPEQIVTPPEEEPPEKVRPRPAVRR